MTAREYLDGLRGLLSPEPLVTPTAPSPFDPPVVDNVLTATTFEFVSDPADNSAYGIGTFLVKIDPPGRYKRLNVDWMFNEPIGADGNPIIIPAYTVRLFEGNGEVTAPGIYNAARAIDYVFGTFYVRTAKLLKTYVPINDRDIPFTLGGHIEYEAELSNVPFFLHFQVDTPGVWSANVTPAPVAGSPRMKCIVSMS